MNMVYDCVKVIIHHPLLLLRVLYLQKKIVFVAGYATHKEDVSLAWKVGRSEGNAKFEMMRYRLKK